MSSPLFANQVEYIAARLDSDFKISKKELTNLINQGAICKLKDAISGRTPIELTDQRKKELTERFANKNTRHLYLIPMHKKQKPLVKKDHHDRSMPLTSGKYSFKGIGFRSLNYVPTEELELTRDPKLRIPFIFHHRVGLRGAMQRDEVVDTYQNYSKLNQALNSFRKKEPELAAALKVENFELFAKPTAVFKPLEIPVHYTNEDGELATKTIKYKRAKDVKGTFLGKRLRTKRPITNLRILIHNNPGTDKRIKHFDLNQNGMYRDLLQEMSKVHQVTGPERKHAIYQNIMGRVLAALLISREYAKKAMHYPGEKRGNNLLHQKDITLAGGFADTNNLIDANEQNAEIDILSLENFDAYLKEKLAIKNVKHPHYDKIVERILHAE